VIDNLEGRHAAAAARPQATLVRFSNETMALDLPCHDMMALDLPCHSYSHDMKVR
jgi:hypothetical protein